METEELDDIKIGDVYAHLDTGNLYKVTCITKMKHPDNGKWLDCVIYESFIDDKTWVRSLDNFRSHFTLII